MPTDADREKSSPAADEERRRSQALGLIVLAVAALVLAVLRYLLRLS